MMCICKCAGKNIVAEYILALCLNWQYCQNSAITKYTCNVFTELEWPEKADTTVKILCIGTDRSQQTVQTKIRLLLKKQSDQGLRCLPLHQLLLDALMQCYIKLYQF